MKNLSSWQQFFFEQWKKKGEQRDRDKYIDNDRQRNRQKDRQIDRKTDKKREREIEREKKSHGCRGQREGLNAAL